MKKNENVIRLTLHLPSDFAKKVKATLQEETEVACRKWGVLLTHEEKAALQAHALKQVEKKVSAVSGSPWQVDDPLLVVRVANPKTGSLSLDLPSPEAEKYDVAFLRVHDEWRVEADPAAEKVLLKDFLSTYTATIITWARTAVFYGVGSYN